MNLINDIIQATLKQTCRYGLCINKANLIDMMTDFESAKLDFDGNC